MYLFIFFAIVTLLTSSGFLYYNINQMNALKEHEKKNNTQLNKQLDKLNQHKIELNAIAKDLQKIRRNDDNESNFKFMNNNVKNIEPLVNAKRIDDIETSLNKINRNVNFTMRNQRVVTDKQNNLLLVLNNFRTFLGELNERLESQISKTSQVNNNTISSILSSTDSLLEKVNANKKTIDANKKTIETNATRVKDSIEGVESDLKSKTDRLNESIGNSNEMIRNLRIIVNRNKRQQNNALNTHQEEFLNKLAEITQSKNAIETQLNDFKTLMRDQNIANTEINAALFQEVYTSIATHINTVNRSINQQKEALETTIASNRERSDQQKTDITNDILPKMKEEIETQLLTSMLGLLDEYSTDINTILDDIRLQIESVPQRSVVDEETEVIENGALEQIELFNYDGDEQRITII